MPAYLHLDEFHHFEAENDGSIDISIGGFYSSPCVSEVVDDDDIVLNSVSVSTTEVIKSMVNNLSYPELREFSEEMNASIVDAGLEPLQSTDNTKLRELVSAAAVALKGILSEVGEE